MAAGGGLVLSELYWLSRRIACGAEPRRAVSHCAALNGPHCVKHKCEGVKGELGDGGHLLWVRTNKCTAGLCAYLRGTAGKSRSFSKQRVYSTVCVPGIIVIKIVFLLCFSAQSETLCRAVKNQSIQE